MPANVRLRSMGIEYVIRVNRDKIPEISQLNEILKRLPHYFAKKGNGSAAAIEFRTPQALKNLKGMPDVVVSRYRDDILICQYGDYEVMTQILGTLAAEFVSDASDEHIDIYMAGAEPPRSDVGGD